MGSFSLTTRGRYLDSRFVLFGNSELNCRIRQLLFAGIGNCQAYLFKLMKFDDLVKSRNSVKSVIPAEAGI